MGGAGIVLPALVAALLGSFVLGTLVGFRTLVVRSGSMAPSIETGDAVVTRIVHPRDVSPGEVVTFQDPSRSGELVTHRVVEVRRDGTRLSFVTAGDANTGEERWSMDAEGTLGKVVLRIPRAGYFLAWLGTPVVRSSLITGACLALASLALRRIWSRER